MKLSAQENSSVNIESFYYSFTQYFFECLVNGGPHFRVLILIVNKQKVTSHASSQGLHSGDNLLVNENGEFVNRILQHCASLQLVIF